MSNHSGEQNIVQISELGIDELRLVYDREESRNDTFETKAASLFGFSSLLISILIFTLDSSLSSSLTLSFNFISAIIIVCIALVVIGIFIIALAFEIC